MPNTAGNRLSRRDFLRSALGVASLIATGVTGTGCRTILVAPILAAPALLDTLGAERVRQLGTLWRETHAAERSATDLASAITAHLETPPTAEGVAAAVRTDFENDRIVMLDGWMLAVTEARQCALFSLEVA